MCHTSNNLHLGIFWFDFVRSILLNIVLSQSNSTSFNLKQVQAMPKLVCSDHFGHKIWWVVWSMNLPCLYCSIWEYISNPIQSYINVLCSLMKQVISEEMNNTLIVTKYTNILLRKPNSFTKPISHSASLKTFVIPMY